MVIAGDVMTIFDSQTCDWVREKNQEILWWALCEQVNCKTLENTETSQMSMRMAMGQYGVSRDCS